MKLRSIIAVLFLLLLSGLACVGLLAWHFAAITSELESALESQALAVTAGSFSRTEEIHSELGEFISWEKIGGGIQWELIRPGTRDFGTYSPSTYTNTKGVPQSGHLRLRSGEGEMTILIYRVAKFSKGNAHVMIRARQYTNFRMEVSRELAVLSSGRAQSWEGRPTSQGREVPPDFLTMPIFRVDVGDPHETQRRLSPKPEDPPRPIY